MGLSRHKTCAVCGAVFTLSSLGACQDGDGRASAGLPTDTVHLAEVSVLGAIEGRPEHLFGRISAIAVDEDEGLVYVADELGLPVRAFEPTGRFLAEVGSAGEGPGEFRRPRDVTVDPGGRLYVRDQIRITVLDRTRSGGRWRWQVVRTFPLTFGSRSGRAVSVGRHYFNPGYDYDFSTGLRVRYYYALFDSTGPTGDTIVVPRVPNTEFSARASYQVSAQAGRNLNGVNRAPFEAAASWDITTDGEVLVSLGDQYSVLRWSGSDELPVPVIDLQIEPQRVPAAESADSARAFQRRLDSIPVSLDQVRGMSPAARSATLPVYLPQILAVQAGADGTIWVRRWPKTGERRQTFYDVYEPSGRALWSAVIDADLMLDPAPRITSRYVIGVVRDSATDAERVAVFRNPREAGL